MKGLYIKDFKLMMNQKMFFIVIAAMAIFFAVTQTNIFLLISYATFIAAMFVISSISYDEFNNGNAFSLYFTSDKNWICQRKIFICSYFGDRGMAGSYNFIDSGCFYSKELRLLFWSGF